MGVPHKNPPLPIRPTSATAYSTSAPSPEDTAKSAVASFSLVLGGPLYNFLQRVGVVRFSLPNVLRRIAASVAITWLPLLLLSLKDGLAFGHQVKIPLLSDFSVYGRFLLAVPLLLVAEVVIDPAIRMALGEFVEGHIVPEHELPAFTSVLKSTQHLRDSWVPEVLLFALAFFPVFLLQRGWTSVSSWHTTAQGLTHAGWWFAILSTPILRFLIYRWTFRYFVWSILLWRIGRLDLVLMPTHPDHAAGLNFLGLAQKRFGLLFCALGCAFAGQVADRVAFLGIPLMSFKFLMSGFIVLSVVLALLPLTLLWSKLAKVRKAGLLEYGRLVGTYTASFDRKWVHAAERPSEQLLGTSDIQSLADIGNSFAFVDAMTVVPITKRLVLQLTAQAAAPLLPVIVLGTPTPELVKAIMKMVT